MTLVALSGLTWVDLLVFPFSPKAAAVAFGIIWATAFTVVIWWVTGLDR